MLNEAQIKWVEKQKAILKRFYEEHRPLQDIHYEKGVDMVEKMVASAKGNVEVRSELFSVMEMFEKG